MTEKEVIEQIESLIDDRNSFIDPTDKSEDNIFRKDKKALQTILQLLEQKDKRIDELEKALVDEQLKHTDKINKAIEYTKRQIRDDYYCRKSSNLIDNLLNILK